MNKFIGVICAATAALAVSACDSKAQKEVDQQADAIDQSYEAEADIREAVAAGAPKDVQAQARNQAEALRNQGEAIKDHLKEEAKTLKDVPKQ